MLELIHELKIHQAELEIQNEELQQAQYEIAALHREYADLYEFAPFAYLTMNAKGTITRINLSGVMLLGGTRSQILKSSFYNYLVPTYEDLYWSSREKTAKTGEMLSLEFKLKRKDRSIRWVRCDIQADRNPAGEVRQWKMVLVDISQVKEAEAALQQSEERFRVLFENAPIAYYAVDHLGKLVDVNQAWLDMLGYDRDEVIGKEFTDFVCREMRLVVKQCCSLDARTTKVRRFDFTMCKKNGETIIVDCRGKIDQSKPDKQLKVHWVVWDITRQRAAEKEREHIEIELRQAQKMQSVGVLAGGIAHEFNNILSIILGNNDMAMNEHANGRSVKTYLEEIHIASNRAKDVVGQLLAFGRKSDNTAYPTDIVPFVVESLKLIRSTLPANIDIHRDISNAHLPLNADPTQIQQAIINIIKNAADAMPDEKGVITVKLDRVEITDTQALKHEGLKAGNYAELVIGDNGQGIDENIIERIFDPFFSTKDVGKGSGMGLAMVHGIVKRHKGHIHVESTKGKATTFTIRLPLCHGRIEPEEKTEGPLPTGTETILFVDD